MCTPVCASTPLVSILIFRCHISLNSSDRQCFCLPMSQEIISGEIYRILYDGICPKYPFSPGTVRSDVERNPYLPLMLFTGTVTDFRVPGDPTPMLGQSSKLIRFSFIPLVLCCICIYIYMDMDMYMYMYANLYMYMYM